MKQFIAYLLILIPFLFTSCKKDTIGSKSYLTLSSEQSAYEAYESIQELYEQKTIVDLFVEDSFSSLITAKHYLTLYHDFIIRDSIHPDTIIDYKFHFENDTLNTILLLPELNAINQWPTQQVSNTIIFTGIGSDSIFNTLNTVNQTDTFERIINIYLDYKNLEKRFSNNMYDINSWFATEITNKNEEYTIELSFSNGVLKNIERYQK